MKNNYTTNLMTPPQRGKVKSVFLSVLFAICAVVSFAQTTSWNGSKSTSWSNSGNWTNGVPTATVDAIIGNASFTGAFQPTLSTVSYCKSLTIGGTKASTLTAGFNLVVSDDVTINANGTLSSAASISLAGDWSNSGVYTTTSTLSAVNFAGIDQSIGGTNVTTFRLLTVNAGSTVTLNRNMTVAGLGSKFTIDGTFNPNEAPAYVATISSMVINSGGTIRINTATYNGNYVFTGAVTLNPGIIVEYGSSTVNQSITNLLAYSTLKISGTSTKTIPSNLNFQSSTATIGNIILAGGTLDIAGFTVNRPAGVAGGTLSISNSAKLKIGGTGAFPTGFATVNLGNASTVEFSGTTQTIASRSYGHLEISGAGSKSSAGALSIAGNFSLNTATFVGGSFTHSVGGNWNMSSGAFTNTNTRINFNGSGIQNVSSTDTFSAVTINKPAGSLNLTSDAVITALTFTKGNINTGANEVIIPSGGSVIGASATTGWVNGRLQKYFSAAAGGTFEIGGPSHYTPLGVAFTSVSTAGSLIAGVTASSHPNINTSTYASKNISRYWTLSKPATGGIVYPSSTLTFNWNTSDNYTPLSTSALKVAKYTTSAWSYPTITGTSTATTIKATSVTTLGDFAVGESSACTISSGFKYAAADYCSNGGSAAITLNSGASAGTFTSSPAGLSINSATGAVNLNSSTPGTYTVTNTVISGSCTSISTATIVINQAASATISYASALCTSGGLANVILTGTTGGVFSSTIGLDINGATGQIDLADSKIGTYVVTYLVDGETGCADFSTTKTINITAAPVASISYPGSPYCLNGGAAAVSRYGVSGGVYSSTTGLSINATTGDINLSASTAGTYTVTYTIAAANGCAVLKATTSVTIVNMPTASINYVAGSYCENGSTVLPTRTGTAGGTYSSTMGLDLDEVTGAINPAQSVPGTYTVTYTVSPVGGCTASSTDVVTITEMAAATITYAGAPFCKSVVTAQNVTRTGTAGGTYTASSTDLVINASTGAITPSASKAGTYTVTYTMAASGGCSAKTATTSVTITTAPTATTIEYDHSPYCKSITSAEHVKLEGTTGGTFSASPAGLSLNTVTGDIVPSTSVAGTYTVSYTLNASGGCSVQPATTSLTITATPTATISYSGSPFCAGSGVVLVSRTGTAGGEYSSSSDLTINATTGAITPSTSKAGTYTVEYKIAAANGCSEFKTTTTVTIKAAASATIVYDHAPFCKSVIAAESVKLEGTTGGTFSASPAGLTLNPITGAIVPATSTAGTYTVTYTFPASGGCSVQPATTSVTIAATPTATISYNGSPFCAGSGVVSVNRTGTAGGEYSSSSDLTIDATTGAITPSTSKAGTYTVEYKIAAANGCSEFKTTTTVTVTTAASTTIVYENSPYCSSEDKASVKLTGTSGGTYSSTNGLSINSSTGEINIQASTLGTYEVTYTVTATGGCSGFSTKTSVTLLPAGLWIGAISNDWDISANWSCGKVPDENVNVTIPSGTLFSPVVLLTKEGKVKNLNIQQGAILTLFGSKLTVAGSINNAGRIDASNGEVYMKGVTPQVIAAGAFLNNDVKKLTIENETGVTLTGAVNILDILRIEKGTLATGGFLTLKSSLLNTARVSEIKSSSSTPITGNVTVERFVQGRRKYRLITSSVTTSTSAVLPEGQESKSIWGNWQNSGVNTASNVGTLITGGKAVDGFDTQTSNASLYTYNPSTKKFVAFSSANGNKTKYTPLKTGVAYYMFVYGDRQNSISTTTPKPTVLSATGTLATGPQVFNKTTPVPLSGTVGTFSLLGNPYACTIDWKSVQKSGVSSTIWGWDAGLSSTGGYVTVTATITGAIVAPNSSLVNMSRYVQPGQGFFVQTTSANPQVVINESSKIDDKLNINSNVFRETGVNEQPLLSYNLLYTSAGKQLLADGAVSAFDPAFAMEVNDEDGMKMVNSAESISILNGASSLSIDARPAPKANDTIFLNIAKMTRSAYTLEIFANNMGSSDLQPYLEDAYLQTSQQLSLTDTNRIVFKLVSSAAASKAANRFRIVFRQNNILPVTFTTIKAAAKNNDNLVEWNVATEEGIKKYEVERSSNGTSFQKVGEVKSRGNSLASSYSWLDVNVTGASNYYRIRAVEADGQFFFSKVVVVKSGVQNAQVKVFPNPVRNNEVNLQFTSAEKGMYTVVMHNQNGQTVLTYNVNHSGGSSTQAIPVTSKLPAGVYRMRVVGKNNEFSQNVIVE